MKQTIDLVLYEVGGVRFASDLTQVRRIGSVEPETSVGMPLGRPHVGKRALVFQNLDDEGYAEFQLIIDVVLGVHTVPVDDLRRLPPAASRSALTIGAWVVDETHTVLLIDLHAIAASKKGLA